ncbi:hypothetical protein [Pseudobacteriovorax antillogorgiicola]|nr:hypothetical protein [Pseudobacteriovorax antillogorgiicola]
MSIFLTLLATACNQAATNSEETSRGSTGQPEQQAEVAGVELDEDGNLNYVELYCKHVDKLRLRADVNTELSYMCDNGTPTAMMSEYRQAALDANPGEINLETLVVEHSEADDTSEFLIAWAFYVPIRPFEVKERPIYDFVAQNYEGQSVTLESTASRKADSGLDYGLHLWSTDMNYKVTIQATETNFLSSERNTEYNLYQVQSGNEEMGFGVETLVDTNNPDFLESTMINLSFNDGSGFNNGAGGTVVITMLHFILNNQGFPETATQSINEIAQHTADAMYSGLSK